MARSSLGRPPLQSGRETKKKRKSRSYGALQGCTVRLSQGRGGFSKLRGVRERREAPRVGAQAEANEDERRGRERQLGRGGGGSCFERFHSSMVPDYPSFCYHTVRPCPPFFASSVHRSRFASSSHFGIGQVFFYSIDFLCRPCRRCTARLLHYACASSRA